jgi:hypothetical protein
VVKTHTFTREIGVSLLKQIPAMAFQAVDESCLMVAPDSGEARAKPGCPIG